MSDRKPGKHMAYDRITTSEGHQVRTGVIKSFWYRACFTRQDVPIDDQGNTKKVRVPTPEYVSLRTFVKQAISGVHGTEAGEAARKWSHNKRVNASNPPLGIGRTSKSKNGGGGGKKSG